jgi:hypothetical protein
MIAGRPLAVSIAERWLSDRCTVEQPDRTQSTGYRVRGTDVPCRLIDDAGSLAATPGGLLNVQGPRVYFRRTQTLGTDWRLTITSQADRRLKVDSIVAPPEAPLQYVTAAGTR